MEVCIRLSYPLDKQSVSALFLSRNCMPLKIYYTCHVVVPDGCAYQVQDLSVMDHTENKRCSFKVCNDRADALVKEISLLKAEIARLKSLITLLTNELKKERDELHKERILRELNDKEVLRVRKQWLALLKTPSYLNFKPSQVLPCRLDVSDAILPDGIL